MQHTARCRQTNAVITALRCSDARRNNKHYHFIAICGIIQVQRETINYKIKLIAYGILPCYCLCEKGTIMSTIFDVAKYILSEYGEMSTMKLQKLCYYSLVEGLVSDSHIAIFNNKFEAWANGPVCRDLWNVHKGLFYMNKSLIPESNLTTLPQQYKNFINVALEKYGKFNGAELSAQTHKEKPWIDAIGDVNSPKNSSHVISKQSIINYYSALPK